MPTLAGPPVRGDRSVVVGREDHERRHPDDRTGDHAWDSPRQQDRGEGPAGLALTPIAVEGARDGDYVVQKVGRSNRGARCSQDRYLKRQEQHRPRGAHRARDYRHQQCRKEPLHIQRKSVHLATLATRRGSFGLMPRSPLHRGPSDQGSPKIPSAKDLHGGEGLLDYAAAAPLPLRASGANDMTQ